MSDTSDQQQFVKPGHFYSPVTDRDANRQYLRSAHYEAQCARVDAMLDMTAMFDHWAAIEPLVIDFPFEQSPEFRYYGRNNQFEYFDASILSGMIALINPERIIEIGAGFSSAAIFDAVERSPDMRLKTFTTIDPDLSRIRKLSPPAFAEMIEAEVQSIPVSRFQELQSGDILFIDSSHVLKTGSDVHYEFLNILPALRPGVFVHVHDVFYPFEYPKGWLVADNRSWNEAYLVDMLLTHSRAYEIVFFNDVFLSRFPAEMHKAGDMFDRFQGFNSKPFHKVNGSIWLRKRG